MTGRVDAREDNIIDAFVINCVIDSSLIVFVVRFVYRVRGHTGIVPGFTRTSKINNSYF